ncbi:hypothetical protein [Paenibacillus fonticola]|uniref:hypothetical protein n=1 Tax=Paenibacillus fonticola TaxID=379896 RepID=UPI00037218FD|nr:hypothetical protein [Paenibacillus fonticola]
MIFGNGHFAKSPVQSQKYIWLAEYYDGTFLTEYDLENRKTNSFYDIDKNKLIRFGLIGCGNQIYFDVANGIFNINHDRIMISYVTKDTEYPLTGRTLLYNDIIQFKEATAEANLLTKGKSEGRMHSSIVTHAIGYKKAMDLAGVNIHFQTILHLPLDQPAYVQIKISSSQDLNGKLIVRMNGLVASEIEAPLKANMAGIINWTP